MKREVQIECKINGMKAGIMCEVKPGGEIGITERYIVTQVFNKSCPLSGISECKYSECVLAIGSSFKCFNFDDKNAIV